MRFLPGKSERLAHDGAPINQKATTRDQRWQMFQHSTIFPRTGPRDLVEDHILNSFDFCDVEMIDEPGIKFNLRRAQVNVLGQSP